jgi:hypothetical protein
MVAEAAMAGGAVVDTKPTDGAEAERLAGVEEAALPAFGSRAAAKAREAGR